MSKDKEVDGSWMENAEHGFEGIDTTESGSLKCLTRNNRLWMPAGSERIIIFLEDEPKLAVWEHSCKVGGDWRNYATCLCHLKVPCPLDLFSDIPSAPCNRYKMTPMTVIDTSSYTATKGKEAGKTVSNQKRMLAMKNGVLEKLARRAKELKEMKDDPRFPNGKTLKFAKFKVYRGKDAKTSPSTGDDFSYLGHVDPSTLTDIVPLDYAKLLAPDLKLVMEYCNRFQSIMTDGGSAKHEEDDAADTGVAKVW